MATVPGKCGSVERDRQLLPPGADKLSGRDTGMAHPSHPRVSIGLPVFNGQRYLPQAIEAILAQTYGDFELIISDNASIDGTAEICREYAERDQRIRYLRQPTNIGAGPIASG